MDFGIGFFSLLIKIPLLPKFLPELLERQCQYTLSIRLDMYGIELILTSWGIDPHRALNNDVFSFFQTKLQLYGIGAEHNALDSAFIILDREIDMAARLVIGNRRDLSLHLDVHKGRLEK